jgi:hypothetical protein
MAARLTRRRFARLAIAGGVAAGSIGVVTAPFANTIFARPVESGLIGIKPGPISIDDPDPPEVARTEVQPATGGPASVSRATSLLVHAFDLSTGQVRSVRSLGVLADGRTPALLSNEVISGSAVLKDGTLILAITPIGGSANQKDPSRITRATPTGAAMPVAGLRPDEMLADLLAAADGSLLGLATQRNGAAPARVVSIDIHSGRLSSVSTISLPGFWRVNTLTQSPQGQLLSTAVNRNGETHLIQVGGRQSQTGVIAPLRYGSTVWNNGLQNLVYSSDGDLIAFGALRYETTSTLYRLDANTGDMTRLYDFDVASVAAVPA